MQENQTVKKRSVGRRVLRIAYRTVLIIILVVALVALSILTPPVQNFIRGKAVTWLTQKLHTRVAIGRIYIGFPKKVVIENVYVEDKAHDTLLAGGKLQVDISMLKLLHSEVEVSQVSLSDLTAKVRRQLPDTVYNFQFIVDAFASKDTAKKDDKDTSGMKVSVRGIALDRIRLLYKDDVTGNDVTLGLKHFDTKFDVFDLDHMRFRIPETNVSGINAFIYQHKPLQPPAAPAHATDTAASMLPDVSFDKFTLSAVNVDYGNDISKLYSTVRLGDFTIAADKVDMAHQSITLQQVSLRNTSATVRIGRQETARIVAAKTDSAAVVAEQGGWRVLVKNVSLDDNHFAFSNDNAPAARAGIDYMHLDLNGLTLHANNLSYSPDSISGSITKGSMSEKSGFRLNTFQTDFLYASNEAYLRNLLVKTPGTTLQRSISLRYPSLEALKKNIGSLRLDVDLRQSRIQVKDVLTFAPFLASQPAMKDPASTWLLDGLITGSVANMNIHKLQLKAFGNTSADLHGIITGLPDANRLHGDLVINSLRTTRSDLQLIAPKGSLPSSITIPATMNLSGRIAGSIEDARADLNLATSLGAAAVKGTISHPTDKRRARYDATLTARELDLGKILRNDSLYGRLSATFTFAGYGLDPKTANARVNGTVSSATLNRYTYRNIRLNGQLANQLANLGMNIQDPNITIAMTGKADLSRKAPAVSMNATIDSIKTFPLHLTTDTIQYHGNIALDFPSTDLKDLRGTLFVTGSQLFLSGKRYRLDTISLAAGRSDSGQFIRMKSDAINFALTGKYNIAQLGSVFQQAIQPYYALTKPSAKADTLDSYDFVFNGQVVYGPMLRVLAPTLTSLDPVSLRGRFASHQGFETNVTAPLIVMGANRIQNFRLNAGTSGGAIRLRTDIDQFSAGSSLIVYATRVDANVANNKIDFLLNFKDQNNRNKYRLGGVFAQLQPETYSLSLNPDSLLLNYNRWTIAQNNAVKLKQGDVNISDFTVSYKGQELSLNSASADRNAPLEVKFANFRIGTLTAFARQDSLLADGVINGQAVVRNIVSQPVFTSDLTITDLMVRKDTVGNLALKVNNTVQNTYAANVALTGKGNDLRIDGTYLVKPANQSEINMDLDIRALQMTSIEALSFGSISKAKGFLSGKFDLKGTFDKPNVNGQLTFNQTGFTPTMLGSYFTVDRQSISVDNEGISFDNFTVKDSANNTLTLDGNAYTTNFVNYKFDLGLSATNFQALNSTKVNSKLFYGKFFFDTDLDISGTEASPVIDGDLVVNENTRLTIVLPQDEPGVVDREGIVRFVDLDSLGVDTTLTLASKDSMTKSALQGMDIAVNIEVKKEAELTLVVDEGNGDFLRMQGTAQLTGGIDPSGKTTLTGTYEIDKGQYNLSFNFIKRQFDIRQGSKITWLGDPLKANIDLTAIYVANTSPQTLVDQSGGTTDATYKQKLPFEVNLILQGELMKPIVTFDVTLPEGKNFNVSSTLVDQVQGTLADLRTQPDQLNKQVFALLLLNRFVAQDPFASSGGGGFNAGTAARQSVSKILSDQLNNLASDLIKGVDLNFDLASNEDYTTGQMENRTDLNVSLSKQLLNDRLKVTVGSNFELEGPQATNQRSNNLAGNVALDYMLSKDGRYLVRAYRKNEYEGELDGYIIETGLNFIIRFDYDQFKELFHSPRKQLRELRKRDKPRTEPEPTDNRKAGPVHPPATNR